MLIIVVGYTCVYECEDTAKNANTELNPLFFRLSVEKNAEMLFFCFEWLYFAKRIEQNHETLLFS